MPLQRHAEMVRPYLYAELPPEVFAYLLGRDVVAERFNRLQHTVPERHRRFLPRSTAGSYGTSTPCWRHLRRLFLPRPSASP